jgi:hypothetical protein
LLAYGDIGPAGFPRSAGASATRFCYQLRR